MSAPARPEGDVYALLTGILRSEFDVDEARLRPDALFREELDLDSLDAVDLVARLEETTGLKVSDDALAEARTLSDVVVLVESGLARAGG